MAKTTTTELPAGVWVLCPVRCVLDGMWVQPGDKVLLTALARAHPDRGGHTVDPERTVVDVAHPVTWHDLERCEPPSTVHRSGVTGSDLPAPHAVFGRTA